MLKKVGSTCPRSHRLRWVPSRKVPAETPGCIEMIKDELQTNLRRYHDVVGLLQRDEDGLPLCRLLVNKVQDN